MEAVIAPPRLPRRDRIVILLSLAGIVALAWGYLLAMVADMETSMAGMMSMPHASAWTRSYFVMMAVMWAVMMVGMMVPSAAPMILLYARVAIGPGNSSLGYTGIAAFVSGYVLLWSGFSILAAFLQMELEQLALLNADMRAASPILGGVLLVAAGVYQLTPLKQVCLKHCRSPFAFVTRHWRPGNAGALRMGIEHGLFCLGCCWVLMLLLFVTGVMNLVWVAAIAAFVLVEKLLPGGALVGRVTGGALIAAGLAVILAGS